MDTLEFSDREWRNFVRRIHEAVGCVGARMQVNAGEQEEEPWFRGQGDMTAPLLPSLFRHFRDPAGEQWARVRSVECDLFYEFAARARDLHEENMTDWDILFAMQHHDTPTRLLDWTEALGVAVYFALSKISDREVDAIAARPRDGNRAKILTKTPCVWVLNPFALTELSWKSRDIIDPPFLGRIPGSKGDGVERKYRTYGEIVEEGARFGWDWPVAVYPRQKTSRMRSQRGCFTFHGDRHVPLEEVQKHNPAPFLACVEIPEEAIPAARLFLEHAGITHYSIFPDLPNLSRWLIQKYRLRLDDPKH